MFDRALHLYPGPFSRKERYLILGVHDAEESMLNKLAISPQYIVKLCKSLNIKHGRRKLSKAIEALCIALRESKLMLSQFIEESSKVVDAEKLRKKIKVFKLIKILMTITAIHLSIAIPQLLFLTLPAIIII